MSLKHQIGRVRDRLLRRRLSGHVDVFTAERVTGWAVDPRLGPGKPATLSLIVDGRPVLNIAANQSRADVLEAGLGPLHCGFSASLPRSLRDGRAHRVELRFDRGGPVLRGGVLTIAGRPGAESDTATEAAPPPPAAPQGVAYLDRRRGAIAGWAMGVAAVWLRLPGQDPLRLALDRPVPGLGEGVQHGFFHPLPAALMDGAEHRAEVWFDMAGPDLPAEGARPEDAARLDGSPVVFRIWPDQPVVDLVSLSGPVLRLRLCDGAGHPLDPAVAAARLGLTADGQPVALQPDDSGARGLLTAVLPAGAQEICLLDQAGGPAVVLGRYWWRPEGLWADTPAAPPALPEGALSDEGCAAARAAFAAFCAAPDRRFDALWYGWTQDLPPDAALQHYRSEGAASGASPSPRFDEARARAAHPALAAAIAEGRLPCAFALDLVLGPGRLLPDLAPPDLAPPDLPPPPAVAPPLRVASLPPPAAHRAPAQCIYGAWVARLDIDSATRAALDADEAAMRDRIRATPLRAAPLVSIIMPTYNRAYTLGEAVQSVLEQSYPNWELLVCDDASEDKTAAVMRGYDDPRIRYMVFTKSNGAATRNKGLRFARGEVIAYLDSDNIWHPQFLDLMLRALQEAPGNAIAYGAYLDTEIQGARVRLDKVGRAPFRPVPLSSRNFMDLNTIVHHRRVHDWMGGFDESLPRLQDWDLMLRYTSIFQPVYVDHVGVYYRRNVAWGQVTHLFTNSGAQDSVNDKTTRRLTQAHERLAIDWPARGRVTVLLAGDNPGRRLMAESLARLILPLADVDLLDLSGAAPDPAADDPAGLCRHRLPAGLARDGLRLAQALPHLLRDQPVFVVGGDAGGLALAGPAVAERLFCLRMTGQGVVLQAQAWPDLRFHLGALPLTPASVAAPPAGPAPEAGMALLFLALPRRPDDAERIRLGAQAQARGLAVLLAPPDDAPGGWQMLAGGRLTDLSPAEGLAALARVRLGASLSPLGRLPALDFSLLNALQGQGVPLAVPRQEDDPTDMAGQWVEARAAYDIRVPRADWLFDKLAKLLADRQSHDVLAERGRRVHQINLHPELAQERMAHALYRLLFERPEPGEPA